MTIGDYITYFEAIAKSLVDILHTEESKRFTTLDIHEALNGMISDMDFNEFCMLLTTYEGQLQQYDYESPIYHQSEGGFMIIKHVEQNDFRNQDQTYREAEIIGYKIIAKILEDKKQSSRSHNCPKMITDFDANSVETLKVGPKFDNCFGMLFTFSITSNVSDYVKYRKEDWQE
ncbi:hypothetical protein V9L05_01250 [Bernardetia sp. Wsw4-3y2]|uniref:hypothetical protein n=1 Tax=Bernardetia sp. Wsw4-3y2 TaxID=3127471 RepID=UPI0030D018A5